MADDNQSTTFDDNTIFWSAVIGFLVGAVVWLFRVPQRGEETRSDLVDFVDRDPVEESLEAGKALARERQERLN